MESIKAINVDPILTLSSIEIREKLRNGEITSVDLTKKLISHIKTVNIYINAIVAERFELAIKEAEEADKLLNIAMNQYKINGGL